MYSEDQASSFAAACQAALRDAFLLWQHHEASGTDPQVAFADLVEVIVLEAIIRPGVPAQVSVQIKDRRLGSAPLFSYEVVRRRDKSRLFRSPQSP